MKRLWWERTYPDLPAGATQPPHTRNLLNRGLSSDPVYPAAHITSTCGWWRLRETRGSVAPGGQELVKLALAWGPVPAPRPSEALGVHGGAVPAERPCPGPTSPSQCGRGGIPELPRSMPSATAGAPTPLTRTDSGQDSERETKPRGGGRSGPHSRGRHL